VYTENKKLLAEKKIEDNKKKAEAEKIQDQIDAIEDREYKSILDKTDNSYRKEQVGNSDAKQSMEFASSLFDHDKTVNYENEK